MSEATSGSKLDSVIAHVARAHPGYDFYDLLFRQFGKVDIPQEAFIAALKVDS